MEDGRLRFHMDCWFVIIILKKKKLICGVAVGVCSWVNSVVDLRWTLVDVGINLVGG